MEFNSAFKGLICSAHSLFICRLGNFGFSRLSLRPNVPPPPKPCGWLVLSSLGRCEPSALQPDGHILSSLAMLWHMAVYSQQSNPIQSVNWGRRRPPVC
jgi:hypothetical protein